MSQDVFVAPAFKVGDRVAVSTAARTRGFKGPLEGIILEVRGSADGLAIGYLIQSEQEVTAREGRWASEAHLVLNSPIALESTTDTSGTAFRVGDRVRFNRVTMTIRKLEARPHGVVLAFLDDDSEGTPLARLSSPLPAAPAAPAPASVEHLELFNCRGVRFRVGDLVRDTDGSGMAKKITGLVTGPLRSGGGVDLGHGAYLDSSTNISFLDQLTNVTTSISHLPPMVTPSVPTVAEQSRYALHGTGENLELHDSLTDTKIGGSKHTGWWFSTATADEGSRVSINLAPVLDELGKTGSRSIHSAFKGTQEERKRVFELFRTNLILSVEAPVPDGLDLRDANGEQVPEWARPLFQALTEYDDGGWMGESDIAIGRWMEDPIPSDVRITKLSNRIEVDVLRRPKFNSADPVCTTFALMTGSGPPDLLAFAKLVVDVVRDSMENQDANGFVIEPDLRGLYEKLEKVLPDHTRITVDGWMADERDIKRGDVSIWKDNAGVQRTVSIWCGDTSSPPAQVLPMGAYESEEGFIARVVRHYQSIAADYIAPEKVLALMALHKPTELAGRFYVAEGTVLYERADRGPVAFRSNPTKRAVVLRQEHVYFADQSGIAHHVSNERLATKLGGLIAATLEQRIRSHFDGDQHQKQLLFEACEHIITGRTLKVAPLADACGSPVPQWAEELFLQLAAMGVTDVVCHGTDRLADFAGPVGRVVIRPTEGVQYLRAYVVGTSPPCVFGNIAKAKPAVVAAEIKAYIASPAFGMASAAPPPPTAFIPVDARGRGVPAWAMNLYGALMHEGILPIVLGDVDVAHTPAGSVLITRTSAGSDPYVEVLFRHQRRARYVCDASSSTDHKELAAAVRSDLENDSKLPIDPSFNPSQESPMSDKPPSVPATVPTFTDVGKILSDAAANGLARSGVEVIGDRTIEFVRDAFERHPMIELVLSTERGREIVKGTVAASLVILPVFFPAMAKRIPKPALVQRIAAIQFDSSMGRVGKPFMEKGMKFLEAIVKIGETMPELEEVAANGGALTNGGTGGVADFAKKTATEAEIVTPR